MPSPLASWYRRAELHAQAEKVIARAVLDSVGAEALPHRNGGHVLDAVKLRGVPVVGRHSAGGAIRDSVPGARLMRRQQD